MTIDGKTADDVVTRLDAWRQSAAVKGRDRDVELIDAVIGMIRALFPLERAAAPDLRGRAAPAGTQVAPTEGMESCPLSQSGRCALCRLPGQPFVMPEYPGRVFQCLADRDMEWRYRVDPRPYACTAPPMTKDQAEKQLASLRAAEKKKMG
jgi:hypothetical protein